jgi:predicted O-methyltransferase YrrM
MDGNEINAAELHSTTQHVLHEMYNSETLLGTESSNPITVDKMAKTDARKGADIHRFMRAHAVKTSLEIGFAYGFSTVWMLDALRPQTNSHHIAIDPFEKTYWHGIGLAQVKRLGFHFDFHWIDDLSIHALSDLIRRGERFDFIYIDGNHRFDDVLVDFYLSDQALKLGGHIAFDDTWMGSIKTVANFIRRNRAYKEISEPGASMMIFRKEREDDRDWHHFTAFPVATERGLLLKMLCARGLSPLRRWCPPPLRRWFRGVLAERL